MKYSRSSTLRLMKWAHVKHIGGGSRSTMRCLSSLNSFPNQMSRIDRPFSIKAPNGFAGRQSGYGFTSTLASINRLSNGLAQNRYEFAAKESDENETSRVPISAQRP